MSKRIPSTKISCGPISAIVGLLAVALCAGLGNWLV